GMAITEAIEAAVTGENTKYSLGSVLDFVLLHQTVIGEEALKQMAMVEETPDVVIGCAGGGSNFSGLAFPFVREKLAGRMDPVIRAVEPAAAPSMTKGVYEYDFGDTGMMTPLAKMHTLGHDFIPEPIHAGGLRYHGMAPLVSHLKELGVIEAEALHQNETFRRGLQFARAEGIIPGPEPTHAIASAMTEAERAKENGEEKVILFNLSGHGHFDMGAYQSYLSGEMVDYEYPADRVAEALARVPVVAG
ncbi:MAG TPA: pyridoxal-phosphate dependent enzyme, partial [Acidimicrobiia bacterium]